MCCEKQYRFERLYFSQTYGWWSYIANQHFPGFKDRISGCIKAYKHGIQWMGLPWKYAKAMVSTINYRVPRIWSIWVFCQNGGYPNLSKNWVWQREPILVGGAMCPSWEMMEFVNGKDDIPYMKWKIIQPCLVNQHPKYIDPNLQSIGSRSPRRKSIGWARKLANQLMMGQWGIVLCTTLGYPNFGQSHIMGMCQSKPGWP